MIINVQTSLASGLWLLKQVEITDAILTGDGTMLTVSAADAKKLGIAAVDIETEARKIDSAASSERRDRP